MTLAKFDRRVKESFLTALRTNNIVSYLNIDVWILDVPLNRPLILMQHFTLKINWGKCHHTEYILRGFDHARITNGKICGTNKLFKLNNSANLGELPSPCNISIEAMHVSSVCRAQITVRVNTVD